METKTKLLKIAGLSKAELHIHSNYSDGKGSIEEILEYVEHNTDLKVIAITDHDTIEGAKIADKLVKNGDYRFDVIIGEEVTSRDGHIAGLFLKEKVNPGMSARRTVNAIHRQGGLAIAVHPFFKTHYYHPDYPIMRGVGAKVLLRLRGLFDAIEVINATPTMGYENYMADLYNKTIVHTAETGASDAHIIGAIGHGYTLFEGNCKKDLKNAIKKAQTKAMSKKWSILEMLRYLYFFIPSGLRILTYSILHPRQLKNS